MKRLIALAATVIISLICVTNGEGEMHFEDWAVINDYGDCCCICNNYLFYAVGITVDYESWGPTEFHISKIDINNGNRYELAYKPKGYQIALVPVNNKLFIVSIDHDSVEISSPIMQFEHYYSLTIVQYDFASCDVFEIFSETAKGEVYAYSDIVVCEDHIFLLGGYGQIDSFDTKSLELTTVYKTEFQITNKLFTNHAVIHEQTLFFSIETGDIVCLNIHDNTSFVVTDGFYKQLPRNPAMVGHLCCYVYNNKMYYWNEEEQSLQSVDLLTLQKNIEDIAKTCFWWIGANGMYYSKWTDGNRAIFYYCSSDNQTIALTDYLSGGEAFVGATGLEIDLEWAHSTVW